MTDEPVVPASRKDRFIAKLADFLVRAVYRDVEVHWAVPPPVAGPQLTVSNHFGGLSDALVLLHALPRRPGIVARDVIWKTPVVGRLMDWIGGIPVHKPDDGAVASANDQMFASCYRALRDGGHLLIFPEGVTRNEPSIAEVKTGAARIALGARSSGAEGIRVMPVGIHYEDKAALRSRLVVIGEVPLDLDEMVGEGAGVGRPVTAEDRDAVRTLTDEIEVRLRRAAPDFEDWEETRALTTGAEVALRSRMDDPRDPVPIGLRDRLANVLADRSLEQRRVIGDAVASYRGALDGAGLTDGEVCQRVTTGRLAFSLVWQALVGLLLLPFAAAGAVINFVPYLIVKAVGLLRVSPSMFATVKPAAAIVSFGLTWAVWIWWAFSVFDLGGAAAAVVLLPFYLGAVIVVVEHGVLAWRLVRRWRAGGELRRLDDQLAAEREAVVRAVLAL